MANTTLGGASAHFLNPKTLDDFKTGIWRIQDSSVIFFDIRDINPELFVRAIDYLRGYVDCCHGRMAMISKDLLMVAPNNVSIDSDEFLDIYHAWEEQY